MIYSQKNPILARRYHGERASVRVKDSKASLRVERLRRLQSWMQGVPAPPLRMSIVPTNVCNLRCKMCGVSAAVRAGKFKVSDELTDEEWLCIIREGAQMGILEWWVGGGGEPLVRRELIMSILGVIRRYSPHSEIELTTNGTRFTEDALRRIVELDLDRIHISLDFPDAVTHDRIRGAKGTFDKVVGVILRLNELKGEMGKHLPLIATSTVLSGLNYNRLDEMVGLAAGVGIDEIIVTPLRVPETLRKKMTNARLVMDDEQQQKAPMYVEGARRLASRHGTQFQFLNTNDRDNNQKTESDTKPKKEERLGTHKRGRRVDYPLLNLRCYEPWYTMAVDAWENPGPCVGGAAGDPRYNLRRYTLHDVWYGEYFLNIRSRLMDNKPLEVCAHCTAPSEFVKRGPEQFLHNNNKLDQQKRLPKWLSERLKG